MIRLNTLVFTLLASLPLVFLPGEGNAAEVTVLSSPTGSPSSLSRLVTDEQGRVHLSWVSTADEVSTLQYATLEGGVWQAPQVIASGDDWFVNWADFPFLSVNQGAMTAHWLQKSSEGTYNYDVVAVFRDKENGPWSEGIVVHKDGVSAEHGFVSMLPLPGRRTFMSWLDGRNTVSAGNGGHDGHAAGGMTIRAGTFDTGGATHDEWELDGLVCDCCQTSAAMTSNGPVVVYRDRSNAEIRDIAITRLVDGQWTPPTKVFEDNWQISGCPVNGPSVSAFGRHVGVAWFSAKDDLPTVSLVQSSDAGASFTDRVVVAKGNTNGRVGTAMLASGHMAVSWLETAGKVANIKLAVFDSAGKQLEYVTVGATTSSRRSGFPVIAAVGDTVYVTWTDVATRSVQVAQVIFQSA